MTWDVDTPWNELPGDVRRRIAKFQNGDDDAMEAKDEAWYRHGSWRVPEVLVPLDHPPLWPEDRNAP